MSFTKRQLVEAAYGELALAAYTFDLSPDEIQAGLQRIEGMLRTWKNQGIDTGYVFPLSPAVSDPDDSSGMLDFYEEAVRTNGAIRIAPLFGKTVSAETRLAASLAYQSMLVGRPVPVMQLPRNLPVGAGNRWGGADPGYFTPCLPAGVSDPSVSSTCSCGGATFCSKCIDEVTKILLATSGAGLVGFSYYDQYPSDTVGSALIEITNQFNVSEENQITPDRFYEAGDPDDTLSVRRAVRYCENNKRELHLTRIYTITDEIFIRKQIMITGVGNGSGYGEEALTGYRQISGFLVKGTGTRRIRTRQQWRGSAADPQDAPISTAINVQAENCVFRDFTVFLDFDRSDFDPKNYGADWDVGIFVGTRVHQVFDDMHVMGYWRQAGFWFDVTRQTNLPQFPDPDGIPYEAGTVQNGGDGCTMYKCQARGGKWAVKVAGSNPKPGFDLPTEGYYDELAGAFGTDGRGIFGFSDFTMTACSMYGTEHHSNWRRNDPTMNYVTDTAGGVIWITGMNGSGRIGGMRFLSCRFASFEPYRVRLSRCNRVLLIGCQIETRSGSRRKSATGGTLAFDSTDTYGQVSMEAQTRNAMIMMAGGALTVEGFTAFIDPLATYHEPYSGTSGNVSYTYHAWEAAGFRSRLGDIELRAQLPTDAVKLMGGTTNIATINAASGMIFENGMTGAVIAREGNLDFRAGSTGYVSLRQGSGTVAQIDSTSARFVPAVTAPSFRGRTDDLNLEAVANTNAINFKGGADTFATLTAGAMAFQGASGITLSTPTGNFDIRAGAGASNYVSLRVGSGTVAQIGSVTALFSATSTIRSSSNGLVTLGTSGNRFLDTFTINTRLGDGSTIETSGVGTPEGVLTAAVGSRFWRTDGAAGTRLYWKATGTGNTGWTAIL